MNVLSFKDWLQQQESSPATRTRRDVAFGLKPLSAVGSVDGHSTASPFERASIKKQMKKKKKNHKKKVK